MEPFLEARRRTRAEARDILRTLLNSKLAKRAREGAEDAAYEVFSAIEGLEIIGFTSDNMSWFTEHGAVSALEASLYEQLDGLFNDLNARYGMVIVRWLSDPSWAQVKEIAARLVELDSA